jgi:hypothetical protein
MGLRGSIDNDGTWSRHIKEDSHEYHLIACVYRALDRGIAHLAIQPKLGLWSRGRVRACRPHSADFALYGPAVRLGVPYAGRLVQMPNEGYPGRDGKRAVPAIAFLDPHVSPHTL